MSEGIVAAGHPVTAQAGVDVLRKGGNAIDAAIASVATSLVAEPLLTGLGGGGYMLIVEPPRDPVLLDFFIESPGRGLDLTQRSPLEPVTLSFGDAVQIVNIGASSVGVPGVASGLCTASECYGTIPLTELVAPAAVLARKGVAVTPEQENLFEILIPIIEATPEARKLLFPDDRLPVAGDLMRNPELGDALEIIGENGCEHFYKGEIAAKISDWILERGGAITREDLAAYETVEREPLRVRYHDREILLNPPPNAGGALIAYALGLLSTNEGAPTVVDLVRVMETVELQRTPEFVTGLAQPGFLKKFLSTNLGSTTHISVIDAKGCACSVTCTTGEGSAQVVSGTGVHLNNSLGEPDLSPLGFFTHPVGKRLPSMMAPTIALRDGQPEIVVGSAGSHRIRSAILQVLVNTIDYGLHPLEAVKAPRVHFSEGIVYVEPGIDVSELEASGNTVARFRRKSVFFGGAQAVTRDLSTGELHGAGDPRRGGTAILA